MELDWTTNIVIGLISTLVVFAVSTWSSKGPPDKRGWIKLQPGALYQFAVVGGTLFTLFLAYTWLFTGSNRTDAERQMHILFWLIVAFGFGTLVTTIQYGQARRAATRWRGETLCWRGDGGVEHRRRLGEAVGLRKEFMGPVFIVFGGGVEARIDPYAGDATMLIEKVADRLKRRTGSNEDADG